MKRLLLLAVLCGMGTLASAASTDDFAFVLRTNSSALSVPAMRRALTETFGAAGFSNLTSGTDGVEFALGDRRVLVVPADYPIPAGDLTRASLGAWHWTNAATAVAAHRAHLIVTITGGSSNRFERGLDLTRALAACTRATRALGVYWPHAPTVVEGRAFEGLVDTARPNNPPVLAWMALWRKRETNGAFSVASTGLDHFGSKEIEVVGSTRAPGEILSLIIGIASLGFQGADIGDGDFVGPTKDTRIRVWHKPTILPGRTNVVLRVEF
jgi:hypothetical protein